MIDVKLEQAKKACSPIEVRESGRVIEAKLEHSPNARLPIEVIELGSVTEVKLAKSENAWLPIEVAESSMTMDRIILIKKFQGRLTRFS